MSETFYSTNDERFDHTEMEDAVWEVFDYVGAMPGDERTIYKGDGCNKKAGDYAPVYHFLEGMDELAGDDCGEFSEDWLKKVTKEQTDDLSRRIRDAVNAWADEHALQPTFGTVENVKAIRVRLLESDDWEEVA